MLTSAKISSLEERHKQETLAKERGEAHLGMSLKDAQRKKLEHKRALGAKVPNHLLEHGKKQHR